MKGALNMTDKEYVIEEDQQKEQAIITNEKRA